MQTKSVNISIPSDPNKIIIFGYWKPAISKITTPHKIQITPKITMFFR